MQVAPDLTSAAVAPVGRKVQVRVEIWPRAAARIPGLRFLDFTIISARSKLPLPWQRSSPDALVAASANRYRSPARLHDDLVTGLDELAGRRGPRPTRYSWTLISWARRAHDYSRWLS